MTKCLMFPQWENIFRGQIKKPTSTWLSHKYKLLSFEPFCCFKETKDDTKKGWSLKVE